MKKRGMHVWSDEETAFFFRLMRWKAMWRSPTRCNHEKIAAELQDRFGKRFKKKKCMDHLLFLKHYKKIAVPTYEQATLGFPPEDSAEENNEQPQLTVPKSKHLVRTFKIAEKLAEVARPAFADAANAVLREKWITAFSLLSPRASTKDSLEHWQPIQHEFWAHLLLCLDDVKYQHDISKHMELARRKMAEGNNHFFNLMVLENKKAAEILLNGEDKTKGRHTRPGHTFERR